MAGRSRIGADANATSVSGDNPFRILFNGCVDGSCRQHHCAITVLVKGIGPCTSRHGPLSAHKLVPTKVVLQLILHDKSTNQCTFGKLRSGRTQHDLQPKSLCQSMVLSRIYFFKLIDLSLNRLEHLSMCYLWLRVFLFSNYAVIVIGLQTGACGDAKLRTIHSGGSRTTLESLMNANVSGNFDRSCRAIWPGKLEVDISRSETFSRHSLLSKHQHAGHVALLILLSLYILSISR